MSGGYKWARRAVWSTFVVMMSVGCNPASLSYFLFKGDGKAPAEHPIKPKEGKKEATVAVLVTAANVGSDFDFAGVDRDLTAAVNRAFAEPEPGGKEKKHPIKVIDQTRLDKFKSSNPGWKTMKPAEIGKELGADYILDVTLNSISLYEKGTGGEFYMGQAHLDVVAFDCDTGAEHSRYFVPTQMDTTAAGMIPKPHYKAKLLQRIARDLTWKHIPHVTDQRVPAMQQ